KVQPEVPKPEAEELGGFDPMTGEPLGRKVQPEVPKPEAEELGGFDPMTGEPLGRKKAPEISASEVQAPGGFDPMTGQPIQNSSGTNRKRAGIKIGKPVIIGGLAAVVAVVLIIVAVTSGLFAGKAGKVMMAAANTFKDRPHIVKALENAAYLLGQNKYTVAFSGEGGGVELDGELRNSGKEKQVFVQAKEIGGSRIEMTAGIDSKNVKFQVPQLSNYVFVYDYSKDHTGYLVEAMGEDSAEQLNFMLNYLMNDAEKNAKKMSAEIIKILNAEIKKVQFVNADKKTFTVDDKEVNCKGYTAIITSDNILHVSEQILDLMKKESYSLVEAVSSADFGMEEISTSDLDDMYEEMADELRDEMEYVDDIEVSFYLYKNKLAGIVIAVPEMDEKVEICFEGGDYRAQNILFKGDDIRLRLTGTDNGSKESFDFKARSEGSGWEDIGSLEYNYESGKFSLDVEYMTINGKLTSSKSEVNFKLSDIGSSFYRVSPELDVTIRNGAKIEKYSDKVFDLGEADEDECMDLLTDIEDKLYDKALDWILDY
ncbi:MAG: hypothetical protein K2P39_15295, partial [Lachnospiraceae bacterium]|nr:hypothetical protein [Lachnospiraceae bacterium]